MSIYLDNGATTKIRPEALEKYIEVSRDCYGNPSSLHSMGHLAEKELDAARKTVLSTLKDTQSAVVFTASGSEANNLAIFGRAFSKERYRRGAKIITTNGEHASVDAPLEKLKALGFEIVRIPTLGGRIDMDVLSSALDKNTILVTMMMVNNETGALYDVASVSRLMRAKAPEAYLHVDATQSYLKIPFTKKSLGADMITLSSHKIEGPKGVGALVIDPAVIKARGLSAMILGGGQEMGLRSGTENVPAVAAFGKAAELGYSELQEAFPKMTALRSYLIERIESDERLSEIGIVKPESAAPHIVNLIMPNIKSETVLHFLSSMGIFVSSGSACSSNGSHTSSALTGFGKSERESDSSIRVSIGKRNTKEDVDALTEALAKALSQLVRIKK